MPIGQTVAAHRHDVFGTAERTDQSLPSSPTVPSRRCVRRDRHRPNHGCFFTRCVGACGAISKPDACETDPEACLAVNRDAVSTIFREAAAAACMAFTFSTDFVFARYPCRAYRNLHRLSRTQSVRPRQTRSGRIPATPASGSGHCSYGPCERV